MKRFQIAVIGSAGPEEYGYAKPNAKMYAVAELLGGELARQNCILVCGGKGGVMLAAARGASQAGGITVGETCGLDRLTSNEYIDVEIVTGDLAFRGPSQLVGMSDAVIALAGGAGTLQEICVAYRLRKPIVLLAGYGGWTDKLAQFDYLDERQLISFKLASSPKMAVKKALFLLKSGREEN